MALALRDRHLRNPRGGSFRWSDGPAGVVLVNEFFGITEPEPPEPETAVGVSRRTMQLRRGR